MIPLPLLIGAMVGGAALQHKAGTDAQKRQQREIETSLENQRRLQMQAEKKAMDTAAKFETPKRKEEQQQIEQDITESLIQPVSESQAIRATEQTTQGNVSNDYTAAKATSELETMRQAQELARLLGKTTSAGRLRMNEGIRLMDAGQDIDRLGSFARGQNAADQIAINQSGQVDPNKVFMGQLLSAAGSAGMMAGSPGLSSAGAGMKYGTSGQQASMLAAQEAGMGTGGLWNLGARLPQGVQQFAKGFKV
jgi:hypothetical protein